MWNPSAMDWMRRVTDLFERDALRTELDRGEECSSVLSPEVAAAMENCAVEGLWNPAAETAA